MQEDTLTLICNRFSSLHLAPHVHVSTSITYILYCSKRPAKDNDIQLEETVHRLPFSGDKDHSRMKEEGVKETILLLVNDLHSTCPHRSHFKPV